MANGGLGKTVITKDWTKCPACGSKVAPTGNPVFCLNCGAGIIRMT